MLGIKSVQIYPSVASLVLIKVRSSFSPALPSHVLLSMPFVALSSTNHSHSEQCLPPTKLQPHNTRTNTHNVDIAATSQPTF